MKKLALAWLLVPSLLAAAAPQRTATAPLDVREVRLENGLRIFVLERRASPTFAGYYQFGVGGATDPKGRSGIAHLLEHQMFKGSDTIGTLDPVKEKAIMARLAAAWDELHLELDREKDPFGKPNAERIAALRAEIESLSAEQKKLIVKNEWDELMTRAGGTWENASTSNDVTNYFIQLPANQLETWFQLESDRLLHGVFREFYSERDVVHEERRTSTESNPYGTASEALASSMFAAHPYGTPVVGWPADLERLTERDARAYFTTYYSPSNCTMVLVGDVKTAEVERLARQYFGPWQRQEIPRLQVTSEMEQKGERRRVVQYDAEPMLFLGWPTVPEGHADEAALDLLTAILGGLESSRISQALVKNDPVASSSSAYHQSMRWGGYLEIDSELREGRKHGELEAGIMREIARIQTDGVTAAELERAKVQREIRRVRGLKSNIGQAFRIGSAVGAAGDVGWIDESQRRIEAVTVEAVQAAAVAYLKPERLSVVELRKVAGAGAGSGSTGHNVEHQHGGRPSERGAQHSVGFEKTIAMIRRAPPVTIHPPTIGKDVDRVRTRCGATLFLKEDHSSPSIEIGMSWLGGSNSAPIEDLAPYAVSSSLLVEGGTAELDPAALEAKKEELGMSFWMWTGENESSANFWSLKRNFTSSFELAMAQLESPRFDAQRLAVLKGQHAEEMKRQADYPSWGIWTIRRQLLYGDHPRLGYVASKASVDALTPDDARRAWKRHIGADNLFLTAVGDFARADMRTYLEREVCGLPKAGTKKRDWLARAPKLKPGVFVVEKEISEPAVSVSHEIRLDRSAPEADHAAVEILNQILGGSGFRSRLMERLRSDEGLTYGIYSYVVHESRPGVPGSINVSWETKKDSVAHSIASVMDELQKLATRPVSSAEVEEQIEAWRNRFIFEFENDFYSVRQLMRNELDDRPYDWDNRVLAAVQKVTPADVTRVAKAYLEPKNVMIAIYGTLTAADRATLEKTWRVTVVPKESAFPGGYFEAAAAR